LCPPTIWRGSWHFVGRAIGARFSIVADLGTTRNFVLPKLVGRPLRHLSAVQDRP
jgi:hypothetical protein